MLEERDSEEERDETQTSEAIYSKFLINNC